jgi:hypothetical protein
MTATKMRSKKEVSNFSSSFAKYFHNYSPDSLLLSSLSHASEEGKVLFYGLIIIVIIKIDHGRLVPLQNIMHDTACDHRRRQELTHFHILQVSTFS